MDKITTYNCDKINSQRLFVGDLREYLNGEDSYLHFIKGTILCFCRRGTARIKINYSSYEMKENEILAILPTHVFCLENNSDDVIIDTILYSDEFWASITHSIDYQLVKSVEQNPLTPIPEVSQGEVYTLLDLLKKHEADDGTSILNPDIERSVAGGLAFTLIMLLVSHIKRTDSDSIHHVTRKEILTHDFFELLSQHFETERQVSFYASKLCVTPKHLSTMVKEVTRLPILEWINNVTVLNIKRRLLTSTDTVQQISEDLNFQTPSTFVRYFRQHTGVTPLKYRSSHS
jgi:AraC-like DNA-binding protein